jgi:hypothetical protein
LNEQAVPIVANQSVPPRLVTCCFRLFFAMGKIRGTPHMRSHISIHGATTKYSSNSFVFKTEIEKEGLPRDGPAGLGAGGPEFKSRRPDQSMFFVFHQLDMPVFLLQPL